MTTLPSEGSSLYVRALAPGAAALGGGAMGEGARRGAETAGAPPPEEVGGKAHNLARIRGLGLPVPPAFAISRAALDEVIRHNDLEGRIDALSAGVDARDPGSFERAAAGILGLFRGAILPPGVREEVLSARAARIRQGASLIVRSSAVGEDGAAASFAGQLDSIVDVRSDAELLRAILECWASRWSARCLAYQAARGAPLAGMGVVVQELVASAASGVLFTRTAGGAAGEGMYCEYCYGLGGGLVAGAINPGAALIERRGWLVRRLSAPEQEGLEGAAALGASVLTDARLVELGRAAEVLEAHFGAPQDIEWTFDGEGRLFLLQSRPITAAAGPRGDGAARVTWSNANVNENFPQPISPLLYSIASAGYSSYFLNLARAYGISERRIQAMEGPLGTIVGVHGARIYYNLTNIHAFLSIAPFGAELGEYFNQYVGAAAPEGKKAGVAPRRGIGRALDYAELGVVFAKTASQYARIEDKIREFEATADAFAERTRPDRLPSLSKAELLGALREFVAIRCNKWTNASLADAASAVCYGVLRRALSAALPDEDHGAVHNNLLKGLPDIISSQPAVELWNLSRIARADPELRALFLENGARAVLTAIRGEDARFSAFRGALDAALERWGFRGSGELMLTEPSFQEDPAALLDLVRAYLVVEGPSPGEVMKQKEAERTTETGRVLELIRRGRPGSRAAGPLRARAIGLLLRATQRSIALRERARCKQALLYSRLRRLALEIGERLRASGALSAPDDIFFLTQQEIDAFLAGSAMFPYNVGALVELRRREHDVLSKMAPPDVITLPEGEYLSPIAFAPAQAGVIDRDVTSPEDEPDELSGSGTCGGRVTARAAVLRDMSEAHLLEAGDILVTRQTDPGWGPVFFLIKGLVMERGGMLSHGAIIAREFGIPAVVGVRGATRLIKIGDALAVDGDRGKVRFLGRARRPSR